MIRDYISRRSVFSLGIVVLAVMAFVLATRAVRAGQDAQQGQQQPAQTDQTQGQGQGQSQEKPKKKGGGFFGAMKAATGSSSQQTSATASAGTKGIDNEDGQKIADVTPTAADQQSVKAMESYSLPQGALPNFIVDGHLKPKQ